MHIYKIKIGPPPQAALALWLLLLSAFVTSSRTGPVTYEHNYAPDHDYAPKDYSFSYGVKDLHTGDVKQQWEKKNGDSIRGHYSLVEPDGTVRIVDYTADSKSGFNAIVKHKGTSHHYNPPSKATSHRTFELKPSTQEIEYPQYQYKHTEELDTPADGLEEEQKDFGEQNLEDYGQEVKYVYIPQDDKVDGSQYDVQDSHLSYPDVKETDYVSESTKTSHTYTPAVQTAKLPVDLNVVKPKENLEAVDVTVVKPVEVDLNQSPYDKKYSSYDVPHTPIIPYAPKDSSDGKSEHLPGPVTFPNDSTEEVRSETVRPPLKITQNEYDSFLKQYYRSTKVNPSFQFTEEEYQKFLQGYYNQNNDPSTQTHTNIPKESLQVSYEQGFKPIVGSNYKNGGNVRVKGSIPNTYRTNIRPTTTPGLRNYSSYNGKIVQQHTNNKPKLNYQSYIGNKNLSGGLYSSNIDNDLKPSASRKHRNPIRYLRYAIRKNVVHKP